MGEGKDRWNWPEELEPAVAPDNALSGATPKAAQEVSATTKAIVVRKEDVDYAELAAAAATDGGLIDPRSRQLKREFAGINAQERKLGETIHFCLKKLHGYAQLIQPKWEALKNNTEYIFIFQVFTQIFIDTNWLVDFPIDSSTKFQVYNSAFYSLVSQIDAYDGLVFSTNPSKVIDNPLANMTFFGYIETDADLRSTLQMFKIKLKGF
jgi:hypothetical protein